MIYIGVDPGFTGAIAFLEEVEGEDYACVFDMPVRKQGTGTRIDRAAAVRILRLQAGDRRKVAVVEAISSIGGKKTKDGRDRREGGLSMVNFGRGQGEILGILEALGALIFEVPPATWKANMGLIHVDEKETCKRAMATFGMPPNVMFGPGGGAKHGRAEALFMALYARRIVTGGEKKHER